MNESVQHNIAQVTQVRGTDGEDIRECAEGSNAEIDPILPKTSHAICLTCEWEGNINDCETDDWGENSCPECGETVELKNEY